ncbi:MAG: hypothetical protein ABIS50_20350 [Luteolibacter sp.]|uniref:hypothetical protein n=1 Tax=Luteolibacter sp. TaxID=1962973 RepID=UPI00326451E0
MSTRNFVSGSSIILVGWLGATFLNEVPSQRYPKLDKTPATVKLDLESMNATATSSEKSPALQVSLSR